MTVSQTFQSRRSGFLLQNRSGDWLTDDRRWVSVIGKPHRSAAQDENARNQDMAYSKRQGFERTLLAVVDPIEIVGRRRKLGKRQNLEDQAVPADERRFGHIHNVFSAN